MYGAFCDLDHTEESNEAQEEALKQVRRQEATRLRFFIVMELCMSGDLFDFLSGGPLSEMQAVALQQGMFSALGHLHSHQILHRDVKPENILLDEHLRPKLADLGCAANLHVPEEMARRVCSPGYTAPEVLTGKAYDELSDIFSAGVVTYYSLSCEQPFEARTRTEKIELNKTCDVKYPAAWFCHVSEQIMSLMRACLSKNPSKRPCAQACMEALVHASEDYVMAEPSKPTMDGPDGAEISLASSAAKQRQPREARSFYKSVASLLPASSRIRRLPKIDATQAKPLEGASVSLAAGSASIRAAVGPTDARGRSSAASSPNHHESQLLKRGDISKSLLKQPHPPPPASPHKPVRDRPRLSVSASPPSGQREMLAQPGAVRSSLSSRTSRWIASMFHTIRSPAAEKRTSFAAVLPMQPNQGHVPKPPQSAPPAKTFLWRYDQRRGAGSHVVRRRDL
eukprot:TRINITY_DN6424_c0_g1_i7.p1 TRINITY_DN6424_c0_g1~~TRINITY_DN6424_c0_g1_i7.p1  ORF type:complete len:454 (-),score=82.02 TRINITY_DN6424_c0_g1_i7:264-1625(-)